MATTLRPASATAARDAGIALAVLRVVTGAIFVAHGAQKFFVYGVAGTTGAFGGMGVPMPGVTAPLIAAIELLGGIALILGLGTRIASALLAATMVGAIALVHLKNGFFMPNGFEYAFALLGATAALALGGGGAFSADSRLGGRRG